MNLIESYLNSIQEISIPTKWRKRVEVYILKDDKLVIGYSKDKKKYLAPGGGVEIGNTLEQTAIIESLEEIAIRIKNPTLIVKEPYRIDWYDLDEKDINPKVKKRMKEFRGSETYFMKADFDMIDNSLYGRDNDSMKPMIIPKSTLIKQFKNDDWVINKHRMNLIMKL